MGVVSDLRTLAATIWIALAGSNVRIAISGVETLRAAFNAL